MRHHRALVALCSGLALIAVSTTATSQSYSASTTAANSTEPSSSAQEAASASATASNDPTLITSPANPAAATTTSPKFDLDGDQKELRATVAALAVRIDDLGTSEDKINAVIYWAIGLFTTIIFYLLGYNWYVGTKKLQDEISSLKEELKTSISEKVSAISETKIDALSATATAKIDAKLSEFQTKFDAIGRFISFQMFEDIKHNYDRDVESKKYDFAIDAAIQLLKTAAKIRNNGLISDAIKCVRTEVSRGNVLDPIIVARLHEELQKLPDIFQVDKDAVLEIVQKQRSLS